MKPERVNEMEEDDSTQEMKPTFNVAIIYDDRIAATRAMNVFNGLNRQFGDEFDFQCELWRFDVLALPEAFEAAVQASETPDLIIISASATATCQWR